MSKFQRLHLVAKIDNYYHDYLGTRIAISRVVAATDEELQQAWEWCKEDMKSYAH